MNQNQLPAVPSRPRPSVLLPAVLTGLGCAVVLTLSGCAGQSAQRLGGPPAPGSSSGDRPGSSATASAGSLTPVHPSSGPNGLRGLTEHTVVSTPGADPSAASDGRNAAPGSAPDGGAGSSAAGTGRHGGPAGRGRPGGTARPAPAPAPDPAGHPPAAASGDHPGSGPAPGASPDGSGVCALAENYGQWPADSDQARICRGVYGG
ncbi:hypothetical protein [Kitasatospora sp. NBC_01266]|uniref:hypothetical protein n=1 Tax=Kitasatospora sp. NBC_01266 TaxID=2903572 RepID=UPI002E37C92F|nr:hypothetical protein [Kitasatospora sp. NBC_01266]